MPTYRTIAFAAFVSISGVALAHEGATGMVAERMTVMKKMANSMKTIGQMLNGTVDFDPIVAQSAATALHENCHEATRQFQDGTNDHSTRALPAVWNKPVEFQARMDEFDSSVKALVASAAAGDIQALEKPFKDVGQACSSCHERFRRPE